MAATHGNRPHAPFRAYSERGNEFGLLLTPHDQSRIQLLGRWHTLSIDHLVRHELPPEHWHPTHTQNPHGEVTTEYSRRSYAIRRRLSKLTRISDNPGNHTGPLVGSVLSTSTQTAWFATRYGGHATRLPWTLRPTINPHYAMHAWMAADAGMQIERLGHRVLSERELSSGVDQFGDDVAATMLSRHTTKTGSTATKKPDLAVLAPNTCDYIAIEVERDDNRPLRHYTDKLTAYRTNTSIQAVWYLCRSMTTAHRVGTAANRVLPQNFPLRIVVMQDCNGRLEIPNLLADSKFASDLHDISPHHPRRHP